MFSSFNFSPSLVSVAVRNYRAQTLWCYGATTLEDAWSSSSLMHLFKRGNVIFARTTYCTETEQKPLHSKFTPTAKNAVVTSPPACWRVGQQCDTRQYLSATAW